MIFLAMPYRHSDTEVVERRVRAGRRAAASLIDSGRSVVSPVVSFHETIQQEDAVPKDFEYWETMIEEMIVLSERVYVIMMPGYEDSEGVEREIELARKYKRPVSYKSVEYFGID